MKKQISNRLIEMENDGVKRVAFYGISDEMGVANPNLKYQPFCAKVLMGKHHE